jgi:hypothetical protein
VDHKKAQVASKLIALEMRGGVHCILSAVSVLLSAVFSGYVAFMKSLQGSSIFGRQAKAAIHLKNGKGELNADGVEAWEHHIAAELAANCAL